MAEDKRESDGRRAGRHEDSRRVVSEDHEGMRIADSGLTTAAIAGVAVALINPSLLPGMAIGVAATMGSRLLPVISKILRPIVSTAVRAGYAVTVMTREAAAEVSEQIQDMVAEARADYETAGASGEGHARERQAKRARA
jgi:hypothetical protein